MRILFLIVDVLVVRYKGNRCFWDR